VTIVCDAFSYSLAPISMLTQIGVFLGVL